MNSMGASPLRVAKGLHVMPLKDKIRNFEIYSKLKNN